MVGLLSNWKTCVYHFVDATMTSLQHTYTFFALVVGTFVRMHQPLDLSQHDIAILVAYHPRF